MAFVAANLHLRAGAPGDLSYAFDAVADSMATVLAVGYFNNADDDINLVAEDKIWCQCGDGNMWVRVSSVASDGAVTTEFAGGNLPLPTAAATGTDAGTLVTLLVGHYEVGSQISTASRYVLPVVYAGAEVIVRKDGSGSMIFEFDAGGSGATGVSYNTAAHRRISLQSEADGFHVVGVSSTRWRIYSMNHHSSIVSGGGSVSLAGTAAT